MPDDVALIRRLDSLLWAALAAPEMRPVPAAAATATEWTCYIEQTRREARGYWHGPTGRIFERLGLPAEDWCRFMLARRGAAPAATLGDSSLDVFELVIPPVRIQLRRAKGWRLPPGTVVVSRPGPWGNPFVVGKHGTAARCVHLYECLLSGLLCVSIEHDCVTAQQRLMDHVRAHMSELRGHDLACWCRLDRPCHADVLLRLANATVDPRQHDRGGEKTPLRSVALRRLREGKGVTLVVALKKTTRGDLTCVDAHGNLSHDGRCRQGDPEPSNPGRYRRHET